MAKAYKANLYTTKGRELIHQNLKLDATDIRWIMENPVPNKSIEYNDNRISKYVAQKGRYGVTGEILDIYTMHCHHVKQLQDGGTDRYSNLIIVSMEIHILIHATKSDTINQYKTLIKNAEQLEKLNKLRKSVGNQEIDIL